MARFIAPLIFATLGSASAALADVIVELGAGDDFVIEDSASTERMRVEDSGEIHTPGFHRLGGGQIIIDPAGILPTSPLLSTQPSLWLNMPGTGGAALILEEGDPGVSGQLACLGNVRSIDGFDGDQCGLVILNGGYLSSFRSWTLDGGERWSLNPTGVVSRTVHPRNIPGNHMLSVRADVTGPALNLNSADALNSSLAWFGNQRDGTTQVVAVFDDDVSGDEGAEGMNMWFCDPTDLADDLGGDRFDWTASSNNLAAQSGTPFSGLAAGDKLAILNAHFSVHTTDANFQEVVSVNNGGADLTLSDVTADGTNTRLRVYQCPDRIYRPTGGGIVIDANRVTADPCAGVPEGHSFYNDTSDYYCFCDGNGDDLQMHDPTAACF